MSSLGQHPTEPGRSRAGAVESPPEADLARFFIALGMTGEADLAARLARVDPARADAWLDGLERPDWLTARSQAARQCFEAANLAVDQLRQQLEAATDPPSLRDLLTVADHLYAAALRLDRDVAGG